jgi:hypothetical protein
MDWPSYLRKVVSTAAGTAAGVAAGAGGPIAVATAKVTAEKVSDDLLAQFLGAHADQMQRIEEISLEMRGRLIELQNTVGGLLDAPWHTALAHIEEAGRLPSRRAQELELARIRLFDAWGVAKSLLERDPRSLDPAAMRCPLVAQQIAAVYSFLGEPQNTVHWLVAAYMASRNQLNNQVDALRDIFVQKMEGATDYVHSQRSPIKILPIIGMMPIGMFKANRSSIFIDVYSRDLESKDPLWARAPGTPTTLYIGGKPQNMKFVKIKPDPDFERHLWALVELDAEAQLLRLACLDAGADEISLRPGTEPRSASTDSALEGERRTLIESYHDAFLRILVVFDAMTAARVRRPVSVVYAKRPIEELFHGRYQQILPVEVGGDLGDITAV